MAVTSYTGPIAHQTDPITRSPLDASAVQTACRHLFNRESLAEWVITEKQNTCPVCRAAIDPESLAKLATTIEKLENGVASYIGSFTMEWLRQTKAKNAFLILGVGIMGYQISQLDACREYYGGNMCSYSMSGTFLIVATCYAGAHKWMPNLQTGYVIDRQIEIYRPLIRAFTHWWRGEN